MPSQSSKLPYFRKITVVCEMCGTEFARPPSAFKNGPVRFCSRACAGKGRVKSQRSCEICGELFFAYPSSTARFCSHACYAKDLSLHPRQKREWIDRTCKYCGVAFQAPRYNVKKGFGIYCSRSCRGKDKTGTEAPGWRGGRHVDWNGYVQIRVCGEDMLEHRFIMEQTIGRPLDRFENVHHINGIKTDNRIENLQLMTAAEHTRLHAEMRRYANSMRTKS